jgi:hypothetical protein
MVFQIRRVDYFYSTIPAETGSACEALGQLASYGVNLLAFMAVPVGPTRTQVTLFPEDDATLTAAARNAGIQVDGPHPALLVQGNDSIGALAAIHRKLADDDINVYASTGIMSGSGSFGYLVHVKSHDIDRAVAALEV